MNIVMVSRDADLQKVCREVLGDVLGTGWTFTVEEDSEKLRSEGDLHIWDVPNNANLLDRFSSAEWKKHLILLHKEHLTSLQEKGFPRVNVILKPFTSATLRTFLEQACTRFLERRSPAPRTSVETLRADRDELLQSVIQANLKLQEYDQDRTNFLARAIHDFRAPLTALNGYCGLLLGERLGPLTADQTDVLQRMQHSAKRLSRMANAMFQLSIWQRVDQRPDIQQNDIRDSIDQALHETLPFMYEKQINVSVDVAALQEPLTFEKSQLEQVLINLLDNACKFTPRGGAIEVRGYPFFWDRRRSRSADRSTDRRVTPNQHPNSFRVDIRDSGPGIPATQLDRIFEEYTCYGGAQDRSGGGLGLAICKMILSRHEGRVWAESTSSGAVLSFVLPFHHKEPMFPPNGGPKSTYSAVQI
jgi:signal transduction histidine kinase